MGAGAKRTKSPGRRSQRSTRARVAAAASAAWVAAFPRAGLSQGNYRSAPIGGRSALMGNTGVALGRDGAAPFLNPATIVRINDERLAFSVNFYSFRMVSLGRWHQPGTVDANRFGDLDIKDPSHSDSAFSALPSTLCLFVTLGGVGGGETEATDRIPRSDPRAGRQKLAACLATVERQDFGFTATSFREMSGERITNQAQSVLRTWNRFVLGPTYAIDVNRHLSIGASIHGVATNYRNIWATSSLTYDIRQQAISSSFTKAGQGFSFDFDAIFGAAYRAKSHTIGIAVHTPSLHFLGTSSSTYQSQYSGAGDAAAMGSGDGSFAAPSPARLSLGWGHELKWGMIEANMTYAFPLAAGIKARLAATEATVTGGIASERASQVNISDRFRGVLNAAVGGEYFLTPRFSVLAGFSTDLSAIPDLTGTGTSLASFTQEQTTRVALSLGVETHAATGDFLVGTELSHGWGQMFAVNPYQLPPNFVVIDHSTYGVLLVLAGSTSLSSLKRVVDDVGDMVAPKK